MMDCPVCQRRSTRFVCQPCVKTTLSSHSTQHRSREQARDRTAARIREKLEGTDDSGLERARLAETRLGDAKESLEYIEKATAEAREEAQELQRKISELRTSNQSRLQQLKQRRAQLASQQAQLASEQTKQLNDLKDRYKETAEVLMQTRRVLIRDLCNVFGLRRVRREIGNASAAPEDGQKSPTEVSPKETKDGSSKEYAEDYRIVNVTFPTQDYSRDEFNTGLGYILHITILASKYLSIPLSFPFEHKGSKSFARALYPPSLETGQMPLHISSQPNNYDLFLVGFTMINYDLAYLAHTQGARIHLSDVAHSLRTLWHALHSPHLGRDPFPPRAFIPNATGTAGYYATLGNSFQLDFGKCIRQLATLRAEDKSLGAPNGGAGDGFSVPLGNAFLERLADDALLSRLKGNLVQTGWAAGSAMLASVAGGWNLTHVGGTGPREGDKVRSEGSKGKRKEGETGEVKDGEGLIEADDGDDWLVV